MRGAVISEIRKIFSTRLWWGLAIGLAFLAFLVSAGFAALVGADTGDDGGGGNPFERMTVGTAQIIYNAGLIQNLTTLLPLALGVLLITSEYRHKTITATFLSTPNRWTVLVSKVVAVAVIGAVYAVIHAVASVAGGAGVLTVFKDQPTFLDNGEIYSSLGIGILAFIIWTLLGFGFGMLVRNQVAAVLSAVGAAFILHIALNVVFTIKEWYTAMRFIPGNLTANMLITSDPTAGQQVDAAAQAQYWGHWWQAALVLAAYAAVLSVVGAYLTTKRDVT